MWFTLVVSMRGGGAYLENTGALDYARYIFGGSDFICLTYEGKSKDIESISTEALWCLVKENNQYGGSPFDLFETAWKDRFFWNSNAILSLYDALGSCIFSGCLQRQIDIYAVLSDVKIPDIFETIKIREFDLDCDEITWRGCLFAHLGFVENFLINELSIYPYLLIGNDEKDMWDPWRFDARFLNEDARFLNEFDEFSFQPAYSIDPIEIPDKNSIEDVITLIQPKDKATYLPFVSQMWCNDIMGTAEVVISPDANIESICEVFSGCVREIIVQYMTNILLSDIQKFSQVSRWQFYFHCGYITDVPSCMFLSNDAVFFDKMWKSLYDNTSERLKNYMVVF